MKLHKDFIDGTCRLSTITVLEALIPVIVRKMTEANTANSDGSGDELLDTTMDYLGEYSRYLAALTRRDVIPLMSAAARVMQAKADVDAGMPTDDMNEGWRDHLDSEPPEGFYNDPETK